MLLEVIEGVANGVKHAGDKLESTLPPPVIIINDVLISYPNPPDR